MPRFELDCDVECRAVYVVEAETEEEARAMAEGNQEDLGTELVVEIGAVNAVYGVRLDG